MTQPALIIIVGAGISGLALAQGLFKHGIPFRLFERDVSLHARTQGYRVRISEEGIHALEQNLSAQQFNKLKRSCGLVAGSSNVPTVLDAFTADRAASLFKPGQEMPTQTQPEHAPLSIDRSVLRSVLLEGIEDSVEFGKEVNSYANTTQDVVVVFTDGSEVHGSLLVGADGVWSKLRSHLLPGYRLLDTEGRLVYGKTRITSDLQTHLEPIALSGLTMLHDPAHSCLLEPMLFTKDLRGLPDDYIYWVLFLRSDSETGVPDLLSLSSHEVAALARQLTGQWHLSLRSLFSRADPGQTSALRVLSARPQIPAWGNEAPERCRVTLIGDAIHAMPPTAAIGATTALQDASVLVQSLVKCDVSDWCRALREYENAMRQYAGEALRKSLIGGKAVFRMREFEELREVEGRVR